MNGTNSLVLGLQIYDKILKDGFPATTIIFVIGVFGNIFTTIKVATDRRLHSPTYVALAALALADLMTLILAYIVQYFANEIIDFNIAVYDILGAIHDTCEHSSGFHIIFLSSFRYFIIARPLHMNASFTARRVIHVSFLLWTVSAVIAVPIYIAFALNQSDTGDAQLMYLTEKLILGTIIVLSIIIFHILKMRALRASDFSVIGTVLKRMNVIICSITTIYIFSVTPSTILQLLIVVIEDIPLYVFKILGVTYLMWLLNFAANPVIFFIFSPPVRSCFKKRTERNSITISTVV